MNRGKHPGRFRYATDPTLVVTAVIYGFLLRVAVQAGLFGMLLLGLLLVSLARYAHMVLVDAAHERRLRAVSADMFDWFGALAPVLHTTVFLLAILFLWTTPLIESSLGQLARWVCLAVILVIFPASAATVAVSRDLQASLSPGGLSGTVNIMGARYWNLLLSCIGLVVTTGVVDTILKMQGGLWFIVADAVSVWTLLAMFALIGTAIGEFRRQFGLIGEPDQRQQHIDDSVDRNRRFYLDQAYAALRSGNLTQGYAPVRELLRIENESLDVLQWLFDHMLGWNDPTHAMVVAERYIERLIEERRQGSALDLLRRCRRIAPDFQPSPESLAVLLEFARTNGWTNIAEELEQLGEAGKQR
ncbi:MAG: hypothetical protein H6978_04625 [Gammaproteobacteria bacterium]|nr:hypothetical protein [Gammaproteobacteria bacterium]